MLKGKHFANRKEVIKLILLISAPIILYFVPYFSDIYAESDFTFCIFKNITGSDCYGCGITRAFISVLHLELHKAFILNKLIIVVFPLTFYVWLKEVIKTIRNIN